MPEFVFTALGLAEPVQRAISARNQITPTPIRSEANPRILKGRDILGIVHTGSGKTAAFALPILSRIAHPPFTEERTTPQSHPSPYANPRTSNSNWR